MTNDEWLSDEQSLGWNCQICNDHEKTLKFAEIAQICEFCKSRDARKKFTALNMAHSKGDRERETDRRESADREQKTLQLTTESC